MPKLLSSYYDIFILAILVQSKHLLKKKVKTTSLITLCFCSKSQLSLCPEQMIQVVAKCARTWRAGVMVTAISSCLQQATLAENTAGFLSTGILSKQGDLEPCLSSHIVLYMLARKWDITKYGLQGSSRVFSAWLPAKKSKLFRKHKAIIFAWDLWGSCMCMCTTEHPCSNSEFLQKTEFTA